MRKRNQTEQEANGLLAKGKKRNNISDSKLLNLFYHDKVVGNSSYMIAGTCCLALPDPQYLMFVDIA